LPSKTGHDLIGKLNIWSCNVLTEHGQEENSSDLESTFIGHAEAGDDDVIRTQFRSDIRNRELAHNDAGALYRPVLLSQHIKSHSFMSHSHYYDNQPAQIS